MHCPRPENRAPFRVLCLAAARCRCPELPKPADRWPGTIPRTLHPLDRREECKLPSLTLREDSLVLRTEGTHLPFGPEPLLIHRKKGRPLPLRCFYTDVFYTNAAATDLPAWSTAATALSACLSVFLLLSRTSCCSRLTRAALRSTNSLPRSTLRQM